MWPACSPLNRQVSENIVVDAYAYYSWRNPEFQFADVHPERFDTPDVEIEEEPGREPEEAEEPEDARSSADDGRIGAERNETISPLTDLECILAFPYVRGFDLTTKDWCWFKVDDIEDVEWDTSMYDNLVLPKGDMDLLLAFADRPRESKHELDDFAARKGQGIIILLYGPPGVGKTLTAEAVSHRCHVPLYILSASDLGTGPQQVEDALLHEADVYLECRHADSLDRNELVSIFLRHLEYYKGLMFLTTNRFGSIDPALRSTIDLILPYADLDEPVRRSVWVGFVQRLKPGVAAVTEGDLDLLAKRVLNEREIKNPIKTALVLVSRDMPLKYRTSATASREWRCRVWKSFTGGMHMGSRPG
ncbi:hypothetical protein VTK73DRAFT_10061 [Phialemonium thermophilum]|uniref:AAA+ ATPase domain-containing protein n=1 Tax=Phialemonium thermophilum TaxID=223376 RepID=A0ABR3VYW3_9PEZI